MKPESTLVDDKKRYEPPRLATISLRPEEAVLGHCKTLNAGGGPGSPSACFPFCNGSFGS
jgi:hypothetical protein